MRVPRRRLRRQRHESCADFRVVMHNRAAWMLTLVCTKSQALRAVEPQRRETIARRLAAEGLVAPVMISVKMEGDALEAARDAGAGYMLVAAAGRGADGAVTVSLTDASTRERRSGAELPANNQADVIAERAATALAVRVDPRTSH